ncbi:MAG: ABC transporter substrate-binding protein, partial [Oscillospiraceae bacterium]
WGGKPNLDGVMLSYIPDVTERAQALISKEIHVALDLKGEAISLVKETPWLKVNEVPGMQISYIYFNQKEGVTTDVRVREAMIKALDIENMVKKLYVYGEGSREYMPLSPLSWGYDPNLIPLIPEYDPEGAKALLTEAGYPNGFSIEFYIPDSPNSVTIGMIFQQYMKKNLNIDVELITAPWGPFSDMAVSGKAPIISMSWTWDPDPYFYLNKMFHSSAIGSLGNCQGYSNPQVDKLLDEAVKISDIEERAELYRRALKIIINDRAQIDFSHSKIIVGVSENVQDFKSYSDNSLVICSPEINTWLSE